MRMLSFILVLILTTQLLSCTGKTTVKARIFERKKLAGNSLQIKYRYAFNGKHFIDSVIIKNQVLSSDSIDVEIDPSNAEKSVFPVEK